jgi:hypothetical protein
VVERCHPDITPIHNLVGPGSRVHCAHVNGGPSSGERWQVAGAVRGHLAAGLWASLRHSEPMTTASITLTSIWASPRPTLGRLLDRLSLVLERIGRPYPRAMPDRMTPTARTSTRSDVSGQGQPEQGTRSMTGRTLFRVGGHARAADARRCLVFGRFCASGSRWCWG